MRFLRQSIDRGQRQTRKSMMHMPRLSGRCIKYIYTTLYYTYIDSHSICMRRRVGITYAQCCVTICMQLPYARCSRCHIAFAAFVRLKQNGEKSFCEQIKSYFSAIHSHSQSQLRVSCDQSHQIAINWHSSANHQLLVLQWSDRKYHSKWQFSIETCNAREKNEEHISNNGFQSNRITNRLHTQTF